MSVPVAIGTSTGSHGGSYPGYMTSATTKITVPNGTVAILGDAYYCPEHGNQTLSSGGSTVLFWDGTAVGIAGSVASCGATLDGDYAEVLTVAS